MNASVVMNGEYFKQIQATNARWYHVNVIAIQEKNFDHRHLKNFRRKFVQAVVSQVQCSQMICSIYDTRMNYRYVIGC